MMVEFVLDTNVPLIAKGGSHMSAQCEGICQQFVELFIRGKQILVIDDNYEILSEYISSISTKGPPNFANRFLKWLFEQQGNANRVKQVKINRDNTGKLKDIHESILNLNIDPSDLKFIAVAAANHGIAPVAEASDSKWIGWEDGLMNIGIKVYFICKDELKDKYFHKMG